jgi:hypothetical protein
MYQSGVPVPKLNNGIAVLTHSHTGVQSSVLVLVLMDAIRLPLGQAWTRTSFRRLQQLDAGYEMAGRLARESIRR